jgi:hypothetical protein
VNAICKEYGRAQGITDAAAAKIRTDDKYKDAADFGTKVHKEVKDRVDGLADPDFLAEVSGEKMREEDPSVPKTKRERDVKYGDLNSIRIDLLDNKVKGTVCVYDVKTGKRGLSMARIAEIAASVFYHYGKDAHSFIIVEMRPGQRLPR